MLPFEITFYRSKPTFILGIVTSIYSINYAIVPQYQLNKLTNLSRVIPNMSSKPSFLTRFVLYYMNSTLRICQSVDRLVTG